MDVSTIFEGTAQGSAYDDLYAIGAVTVGKEVGDLLEQVLDGPAADPDNDYDLRADVRFSDPRGLRRYTATSNGGWDTGPMVRGTTVLARGTVQYTMEGEGFYRVGTVDVNQAIQHALYALVAEYVDEAEPLEVELRIQVEPSYSMHGIPDPWSEDAEVIEE